MPDEEPDVVINVTAVEGQDTATAAVSMAAYVEYYGRTMEITGKRSPPPSWIAHE
jgi:hypothetical protein